MNGFIDWHSWLINLFRYEVANKCKRFIDDENRNGKTEFVLFITFQRIHKIKCQSFFMLKLKDAF